MNLEEVITPMQGWCPLDKAKRLHQLVIESDSKISVELGVFGGRSLVPMGLAHKQKGSGFIIGIDPWNKEACLEGNNSPSNDDWWKSVDLKSVYNSCQDHIAKNELESFCETLRFKSSSAAVLFRDDSVDVIHQDSNHNTETIISELNAWASKLKVGGYWVADDTDWQEASEGYSKLPDYGLELVEDHQKWQIWQKVK